MDTTTTAAPAATQPEALRLAEKLERYGALHHELAAAAELRRLHAAKQRWMHLADERALQIAELRTAASRGADTRLAALKTYEPDVVIEEDRGRLKATGAAMAQKDGGQWVRLSDVRAALAAPAAQEVEPTGCRISPPDGETSTKTALEIADDLMAEATMAANRANVSSDDYDISTTVRIAASTLRRLHALTTAAPAAQEAEPAFWVRTRSDGGHEGPIPHAAMEEVRKRSGAWTPLYAHTPRPQVAGAVDAPEGCTPADARILRQANHDLAAESFELQTALRGIVAQAGAALARFDIAAAPQAPAAAVAPAAGEMLEALQLVASKLESRPYGTGSYIPKPIREKVHAAIANYLQTAAAVAPAAAPTQEAEDAARYRYLRSRMEFQSQKGSTPTMGLAVRIVAQHHDPHADWMEPRFSASVDRAIDAARARQEGAQHER